MPITVSPTQNTLQAALGNFLEAILPAGIEVFVTQVNRVPEPREANFVAMTLGSRPRLGTNYDALEDCQFTASIAGSVMDVSAIQFGTIEVGATVYGTGLAGGTALVTGTLSGTGGIGTYSVTPSQIAASQVMAAGGQTITQPTEIVMQLDVHGPASTDNAQIISTLFRDAYACEYFDGTGISPLYAEDPRQIPFQNAESQYEDRWVVTLHMQVDPAVRIAQQFASALAIEVVNVDAAYPP